MKNSYIVGLLFLILVGIGFSACKHSDNSIYFYSEARDTIAPTIKTSVPIQGDIYNYGDIVHIIGNVTDLETVKRSGKLKTCNMTIYRTNATYDTIKKTVYTNAPYVDGKDGLTYNTQYTPAFDTITSYFKLNIQAMDYANRKDSEIVYFLVH